MSSPRSTHAKWWSAPATFFIILWLALLVTGRGKMLRDPGTFWHTVVGEQILRTGELVRTDRFSFSLPDEPWIAQQWLGECAMAAAHRVSHLDTLLLLAAAIIATMYAYIMSRFTRAGLAWPAAALLTTLVVAAGSYHFHPRPHLITLALMAWIFSRLCDIESGRAAIKHLYILPAVLVVWTNFHGGVLGGIATTLVVLAAWFVWPPVSQSAMNPKSKGSDSFRIRLCLVSVMAVCAVFVNPYGLDLPKVWLSLMGSTVLPSLIMEHGPLRLMSIESVMIGAVAAIYILLLLSAWRMRNEHRSPFHKAWLVPLLWLVMAILRVRHGPIFSITAAIAIADMLPHSSLPQWFAQRGSNLIEPIKTIPKRSVRTLAIPASLVILALGVQTVGWPCPVIGSGWAQPKADYWPVAATRTLETHISTATTAPRVFNDMLFGGYLIYHLPGAPVFIDDRCEFYGDAFLSRYAEAGSNPDAFEKIVAEYRINFAMVRSRTTLDKYLTNSPAWKRLSRDAAAGLYEKVDVSSIHP